MKVSISVTSYSFPVTPDALAGALGDVARRADEAGVDTIWVPDHLLQADPALQLDEPMLESATTLGYLAAVTERAALGTLVGWASIRPPAVVVKAVTTLDVLSGGRAWLGLGAGYRGDEAEMMGLPFYPTAERFDRLEELLQIAHHMWSGNTSAFEGPHHRLERPISSPQPVRRPRILLGGMGERRTLPLVARYGDACNLFDVPDGGATLRHKLDVLSAACDAVGRDRAEIETSISTRLAVGEDAPSLLARLRDFAAAGIDHAILIHPAPWNAEPLDVVAHAIAALGDRA